MQVTDNKARNRFEMPLDGGALAYVDYAVEDDKLLLTHAQVPPAFEGRGIGAQLARGVFEEIRARGQTAVPVCSYLVAFARRHPEYEDVVAD